MCNFPKKVDFLKEGIGGDHGGVGGYLFDCEHGVFIVFSCFVVAEIEFGHGSFAEHVSVVYLVVVHDKILSF